MKKIKKEFIYFYHYIQILQIVIIKNDYKRVSNRRIKRKKSKILLFLFNWGSLNNIDEAGRNIMN